MTDATRNLLEQHFDTAFAAPDGIAKLRELILTLAMQGKLVAQDPSDPPASELLKEIEVEKQRLVKEGKIKKPRPLPPIKPEEVPYQLPQGWEWVRLGDVLSFEYGDNLPANKRSNSGEFPVYGSNGIVGTHKEAFVNEPCIVVGRKGSAGALNLCLSEGCCVTDVAYYCVPPEGIDLNFCFKLLHILKLDSLGKGIKPGLNRNEAYELAIAIPPLPEQHRIVARIDQLMARCDELEKLRKEREEKRVVVHAAAIKQLLDAPDGTAWDFIQQHFGELYTVKENVAELRKAILQLAVMGRLAPQNPNDPPASELLKEIEKEKQRLVKEGKIKKPKPLPPIKPEEVPYELPEGWEWVRLEKVSTKIHYGYTASADHNAQNVRLLRITDIQDNKVDWETVPGCNAKKEDVAQYLLTDNDILIARTGGTVGKSYLVQGISVDAAFASYLIRVVPSGCMDVRFIKYFAESPLYWKQLYAACSGTGQPNVNGTSLSQLLLALPPLPEQHRIVSRIDQLMALCDTLEHRIDAATGKQTQLLGAVMAQV
ncbi:MAG: restriction endonuclease subunit S [Desulfovibrionales bacterium]|nr:restriction endonuclease subunit S [Desulfovibrionales bacterium]